MLRSRHQLEELRTLYQASFEVQKKKIILCAGTGCVSSGALDIFDRLKILIEERGVICDVQLEKEPHDDAVGLKKAAAMDSAKWVPWSILSHKVGCTPR